LSVEVTALAAAMAVRLPPLRRPGQQRKRDRQRFCERSDSSQAGHLADLAKARVFGAKRGLRDDTGPMKRPKAGLI